MIEQWKTHPRFLDYEVSDAGRVRRRTPKKGTHPGRLMTPHKVNTGYLVVTIENKPKKVHTLVLETFVSLRPEGEDACHVDGSRVNNALANLKWASRSENMEDARRHGTMCHGERHGKAKLAATDVSLIRVYAACGLRGPAEGHCPRIQGDSKPRLRNRQPQNLGVAMKVYIGYDDREAEAATACAKTLREVTHHEIEPEFLCLPKLYEQGLLTRIRDERGPQDYDLVSNAPYSTRFNISRFLTPILCQTGYALFLDCDMIFLRDPREMLTHATAKHAVSVVKHVHTPTRTVKMMAQAQTQYSRKNWSSVMLFNCEHAANRRLSLWDVNHRSRQALHNFYWLGDDEIGSLDPCWNWLVNEQSRPDKLGIAHFTNGGPFNADWPGAPHDELWLRAAGRAPVERAERLDDHRTIAPNVFGGDDPAAIFTVTTPGPLT
jgi:hypothetical protein